LRDDNESDDDGRGFAVRIRSDAREKTRRDERAFFFHANEPTAKVLVSRTHRLGPELGVHLVHSGVEPAERADVLLVLPRDLFGLALLRRRESARERVSGGDRATYDLFARGTNAFERKTRAIDRTLGPGRASRRARGAREVTRDHHARSCRIPAR
jgi:hypothetical protein